MNPFDVESPNGTLEATHYPAGEHSLGLTFLMLSATGAKQSYYKKFAEHFSARGVDVYTFDYCGIARSLTGRIKDSEATMGSWGIYDLTAMIGHVKAAHPESKLITIGQSVGGQIVGMSPASAEVHGIVNVGSQSGYWNLWTFPKSIVLYLNWIMLITITRIFGYFPGKKMGIMENLPRDVALEWARWGRSSNYLFDHYPTDQLFHHTLEIPLLAYSFSDDNSAPRQAVEWLNARYSKCRVDHRHVNPSDLGLRSIGHFGFFREKCKVLWEEMFEEVKNW